MPDHFVPPDRFDEFRVMRPLGEGTMGAVYLCTDTVLYRRVAVKFLKGVEMDEGIRDRFLNEARAIAQLSHANVVTIYRVGEVSTVPYLASEYVEGRSLERLERPVDIPLLLQVANGAAQGLAAAHRQGILHRDIKPANIMVTNTGEVKLLDFGLAKFLDSLPTENVLYRSGQRARLVSHREITNRTLGLAETPPTQEQLAAEKLTPIGRAHLQLSEQCLGTPLYMAPEVWRGDRASPATDIYSLGAVLYELASGRPPHDADELLALRERALHGEIRPLLDIAPTIPAGIAQIIERCLRRNAAMRFISGEQLLGALDAWARTSGSGSRNSSVSSSRSSRSSRNSQLSHSVIESDPPPEPPRRSRIGTYAAIASVVLVAGATTAIKLWPVGGMVTIAGGSFQMGSTSDEIESAQLWCKQFGGAECDEVAQQTFAREQPQHQVTISPFRLDRREVTNQEFTSWLNAQQTLSVIQRRYVMQGGQLLADLYPMYSPFGGLIYDEKNKRFRVPASFARRPVTQVSWHAATAYCAAHGKRLPTEAEWEYAARGVEGRRFPWGFEEPQCSGTTFARFTGMSCAGYPSGPSDVATSKQDRTEDGIFDLAGNVGEWVADVFTERYQTCAAPCKDPTSLELPSSGPVQRVVRGGTWRWSTVAVRAATRSRYEQDGTPTNLGFRCAASLY